MTHDRWKISNSAHSVKEKHYSKKNFHNNDYCILLMKGTEERWKVIVVSVEKYNILHSVRYVWLTMIVKQWLCHWLVVPLHCGTVAQSEPIQTHLH